MQIKDEIQTLKGVGPQTIKKLNKLGIVTIEDLLTHYPREYEDRRNIHPINHIVLGEQQSIKASVCSSTQVTKKSGKIIVTFRVKDDTGSIYITFFGQPYRKSQFQLGETYIFYGKIQSKYHKIQMDNPVYEKVEQENQSSAITIITPIYPSTYKLHQKVIRSFIEQALKLSSNQIKENLPKNVRNEYKLCSKVEAINNIHFPKNKEVFLKARARLVFEELFFLQLALFMLKSDFARKLPGYRFQMPANLKDFIDKLPFTLTDAQKKVIHEILIDMKNPVMMNRLVQGDVGSGKTVIAAVALFVCAMNKKQGALMAPTEVLATQHYEFIQALFEPFGIKTGLLTGSVTGKQKKLLLEKLQNKEIDIIIGTHALIEENVQIPTLGLAITDEQHRFGVRQRLNLSSKSDMPDILVMTATPIPRTLALILYGDMDISVVQGVPPGRKPIQTYAVDSSYHIRLYRFIEKQLVEGRQAYIICPMVEENEKISDLMNVVEYTTYLQTEVFPNRRVVALHGKMKPKEKNAIMKEYAKGLIDVLVSTTVIEVGVNVPNATIIVIENAERFGLAQLHQLRGRVGRGKNQSYCILVSDSKNKITQKRLKIMTKSTDGFAIAETDLELRGPGEFFGTKQHGLPEMKIANLYTDAKILKEAQKCVKRILQEDKDLLLEEHQVLREQIETYLAQDALHQAL